MKAVVYHGPGRIAWEEVEKPRLESDTDAIVRVDSTTICGTDLRILRGDTPEVASGTILGHEAVGTVECVGTGVRTVRPGDRVLVSCITAWGACRYCREARYGQYPGGGGWILGHDVNGTQAEYVRVPFADASTHPVPPGSSDEEVLMCADVLPTADEVGVLNGTVRPGDTVAIIGAGPVGLAAIVGARLCDPSHVVAVDLVDGRLEAAKRVGADVTVHNDREDLLAVVASLTGGLGADVAIEAVGIPPTFELAARIVGPGGHVASMGVHGEPASLHLDELWIRDATVATGHVDTRSTPMLLRLVATVQPDTGGFATRHFGFEQLLDAYETFEDVQSTGALKVVLRPAAPH